MHYVNSFLLCVGIYLVHKLKKGRYKDMKAKYIGKSFYRGYVYLEYEYRGHRYEVYEHETKGGEPLAWQHGNAQARIDKEIECKAKYQSKEYQSREKRTNDINEIGKELGWW